MPTRLVCSSAIRASGVSLLLLGGLMFPDKTPAQAAPNVEKVGALGSDQITALHSGTSGNALRTTDFTVNDIQKMRDLQKRNADELESLKKIINEQARVIDELKRNGNGGSTSTNTDVSALKRSVSDQGHSIDKLSRAVDDLKRSSGSSGSSSSGELSSLKRDVNDQGRALDSLRRKVDDLDRKVK